MFLPFVERRPWAAGVIGLLLGPIAVMLYVGKGRAALIYVAVLAAMVAGVYADLPYVAWITGAGSLPLHLVGAVHGHWAAQTSNYGRPAAWFARWPAVVVLGGVLPYGVVWSVRQFVWEPFAVSSSSMLPTLEQGEIVVGKKYAYGYPALFAGRSYTPPARGDVVVYVHPSSDGYGLHRVVGLPGDAVRVRSGILHINGRAVGREHLGAYSHESWGKVVKRYSRYRETLPGGRTHHILEESDTMWGDDTPRYTVPDGHVFVLGDNRDNALDSRYIQQVGFIPITHVVARITP